MRHLLNTRSPRRHQHQHTQSLPALAAFTLVEVVISLIIIGILIVIIFEAYITIAKISTRIELEKIAQNDILHATQVIQNIVDTHPIDTNTSHTSATKLTFVNKNDPTKTNDDVRIEISLEERDKTANGLAPTNDCALPNINGAPTPADITAISEKLTKYSCRIKKIEKIGVSPSPTTSTTTYLTSPATHISSLAFTPLLNDETSPNSSIDTIYNNGFWINIDIASTRYSPINRATNVRTQQQTFYNSRKGS